MAKMKATPKTFAAASQFLAGRDSVKLGNNTWLENVAAFGPEASPLGFIGVRLHNTYVVKFWVDGQITLHTGGWYRVTTKDRINEFITGRVYQKDHVWYYVGHTTEGALDWEHPVPFKEEMNVAGGAQ